MPFGVIAGRVVGGVDVRQYGSGSTGTTNVLRTVGRRAAVAVLLLDMGKSVVAVKLAQLLTDSAGVDVATALAAIAGHIWPIFAGFRGGKGISVGWSALFVLSPISGLVATVVGVPVIAVSRYVSLGSIMGAISGCIALFVLAVATTGTSTVYAWYAVIGGSSVLVLHRENISRLIKGEERKSGQRAGEAVPSQEPSEQKGFRWPGSV